MWPLCLYSRPEAVGTLYVPFLSPLHRYLTLPKTRSSIKATERDKIRGGSLYLVLHQDSCFCALLQNCNINASALNRKPFAAG